VPEELHKFSALLRNELRSASLEQNSMGLCLRSTTATIVCAIEEFTTVMAIRTYYVAISK